MHCQNAVGLGRPNTVSDQNNEANVWPPPSAAAPPPLPPPPVYVPPGYQLVPVVPAQQRSTNGFAIASMVLGIVWIYWLGSILALVFGYIAHRQIRRSNGQQNGGGMAIAGIVLGWIGIAMLGFVLLVFVFLASHSSSHTPP
ncbi:MAG TPA: DUF4190 domain-containing protein, partial [Acidimicrobiia bacterium]